MISSLALIFDTVEPYIYETVPILFLQEGLVYEARFRTRHIQKTLLERWFPNGSGSAPLDCAWPATIFIRTLPKQKSIDEAPLSDVAWPTWVLGLDGDALLSPIRHATIFKLELHGDIILVRYRLGPYFLYEGNVREYDDSNKIRFAGYSEHQSRINTRLSSLSAFDDFKKIASESSIANLVHVFEMTSAQLGARFADSMICTEQDENVNGEAWVSVVKIIAKVPFMYNIPIMRVVSFAPVDAQSFFGIRMSWLRNIFRRQLKPPVYVKNDALLLESNRSYLLRIAELLPRHSSKAVELAWRAELPKDSNLTVGAEQARLYSMGFDQNFRSADVKQVALGQYDFIEFLLATNPDTYGKSGLIEFSLEDNEILKSKYISGRIAIPYKIRDASARFFSIISLVALLAASALTTYPWVFDFGTWVNETNAALFGKIAFGFLGNIAAAFGIGAIAVYWIRKL